MAKIVYQKQAESEKEFEVEWFESVAEDLAPIECLSDLPFHPEIIKFLASMVAEGLDSRDSR